MQQRGLRVGLDVYANEPTAGAGEFADPIAREPALYGTHHIGTRPNKPKKRLRPKRYESSKVSKKPAGFQTP